MKQSQTPSQKTTSAVRRRNPHFEGLLAVIDLVLAFLFFNSALDTGSLLQYTVSFVALGLGVRSGIVVYRALKRNDP